MPSRPGTAAPTRSEIVRPELVHGDAPESRTAVGDVSRGELRRPTVDAFDATASFDSQHRPSGVAFPGSSILQPNIVDFSPRCVKGFCSRTYGSDFLLEGIQHRVSWGVGCWYPTGGWARPILRATVAVLAAFSGLIVAVAGPLGSTPAGAAAPWAILDSFFPAQADLLDMTCPTESQCFAVGYVDGNDGSDIGGVILSTTDGGASWTDDSVPPTLASGNLDLLQAIVCPSASDCYAVGSVDGGGVIVETTDAGSTWSIVEKMPDVSLGTPGISCPTPSYCVALGSSGSADYNTYVFATTDAGATWQTVVLPPDPPQLRGVWCQSAAECMLVGGGDIIETDNGGTSWSMHTVGNPQINLTTVSCASPTTCFAAGGDDPQGATSGGVVFTSTDSGSTWSGQSVPASNIDSIACTSTSDCYGGGTLSYGGVMIGTRDGGASWFTQSIPSATGTITGVSCPSDSTCLATEAAGFESADSDILGGPGLATGTTETVVSVGVPSTAAGEPVTYSAAVSVSTGVGTPTGTVTFYAGPTQLCVATLSSGAASCSSDSAPVGVDQVSGSYSGDDDFVGSAGSSSLAVGTTTTAISESPSPALPGQALTLLASVSPVVGSGSPSGTVTFTDGSTPLCTAVLTAGSGSCSTTPSFTGTNTLTGTYSGDSDFASSSGSETESIGAASITTVMVAPSSVQWRQWVSYTASVAAAAGSGTPTGTVTFSDGSTALCIATLAGGTATCSSFDAPGGVGTVVGSYSGDSNFTGSSGTSPLSVYGAGSFTNVSVDPSSVSEGQQVTYTATVVPSSGTNTPTGSVGFTSGTTLLCVATLVGGTGSCESSDAALGVDDVVGTYSGDADFTTSSGSATIEVGATTTSVSTSPTSLGGGTAATYSATVTPLVGAGAAVRYGHVHRRCDDDVRCRPLRWLGVVHDVECAAGSRCRRRHVLG